jgi:hypothetical protein
LAIIDAWMQHPSARFLADPMFDSLRRWSRGAWEPGPPRIKRARLAGSRGVTETCPDSRRASSPRLHGPHTPGPSRGATNEEMTGQPLLHRPERAGPTTPATPGSTRAPAPASWPEAARATLHCLTGCAAGEVLGMVIGTAAGLHDVMTVILSVVLAFVFGYGLTVRGVLRAGVGLRRALAVALAADTVSIAVMELLDNAVMLTVPGAMDAGPDSVLFWGTLAGALAVAFAVTTPLNRVMIGRGKGHAVLHRYHHAG